MKPTLAATGTAVSLLAVVLAGCSNRTEPADTDNPASEATTATTTTTTYHHVPYVPQPEDFALDVQVLEQKCYGSAGCNMTFRLSVSYTGETIYADEGPYTVVYSVTGTEDPFVGRFTLIPPSDLSLTEERVTTPPNPVLTAAVTQVF